MLTHRPLYAEVSRDRDLEGARVSEVRIRRRARLAVAMAVVLYAGATSAVEISTDITVYLSGITVADEDVADDPGAGGVGKIDVGAIPSSSDVNAYSVASN